MKEHNSQELESLFNIKISIKYLDLSSHRHYTVRKPFFWYTGPIIEGADVHNKKQPYYDSWQTQALIIYRL